MLRARREMPMIVMPEGMVFYSVRTTGVYCRPSCAAHPKPENARFHATAEDAEHEGFRPCKRCKPR
jgi:AraC family transcriptional regulator, regulatory protein of adaptative response / methylated-DNA-[protein]-cysteine methyltransferase